MNEGASGSWAPEPEKFATYKGYIYETMEGTGDRKALIDGLWEQIAKPGGLKEWARKIVFTDTGEPR